MPYKKKRNLWLPMIILLLFFWANRDSVLITLDTTPNAEAFEINLPESHFEARAVIVSPDEKLKEKP